MSESKIFIVEQIPEKFGAGPEKYQKLSGKRVALTLDAPGQVDLKN